MSLCIDCSWGTAARTIARLTSRSTACLPLLVAAVGFSLATSPARANSYIAQSLGTAGDGTSRVLWIRDDNAAGLWNIGSDDSEAVIGSLYGPYVSDSSSWHAQAVRVAPDGTARVLWTREDGAMGLWSFDASGNATTIGPVYGPYADGNLSWTAFGLGVAGDGTTRVLWSRSDGEAGVWSFDTQDAESLIGATYGPYSDSSGSWSATAIDAAGDGTSRVLWNRSDGAAGVWRFDESDTAAVIGPVYGPYSDGTADNWQAVALGVDPSDGSGRLLWSRMDGVSGVWSIDADGNQTQVGATYGPYTSGNDIWRAIAIGVDDNGNSHVLWDLTDGTAGVWTFDDSDTASRIGPTYGPY